ncbi:MAG TPA: hypothetical protein VEX62_12750 [Candidatus Limnocylindrales bacterium]|nr:hypothetical protein [Candidatus Limnocylindrales bacterium]
MRGAILTLLLATSLLALPGAAAAAEAPANDAISAATRIATLPFVDGSEDNTHATLGGAEIGPYCSNIAATVWYRISPTSDYTIRIRVLPLGDMNAVVGVYERNPQSTLINTACADDGGASGNERVEVALQAGKTYFIQVGGNAHDNPTGEFAFRVKRLAPPANDSFGNAANATLGVTSHQETFTATLQANEPVPSCGWDVGRTVWYRFTPNSSRTLVARTVGSTFDTVLAVYEGTSLEDLAELACNDDRGIDVASRVELPVVGGTTYFFQVGGYGATSGDLSFRLKSL